VADLYAMARRQRDSGVRAALVRDEDAHDVLLAGVHRQALIVQQAAERARSPLMRNSNTLPRGPSVRRWAPGRHARLVQDDDMVARCTRHPAAGATKRIRFMPVCGRGRG